MAAKRKRQVLRRPGKAWFFLDEIEIMQAVMDQRRKRGGWKCWACNARAKKGVMLHWAVRPGIGNGKFEIVFWDKLSCKQLLQRNKVI